MAIRIIAMLAGLALIGRAALLHRRTPGASRDDSVFSSTTYRWTVAVEVMALFGGGAVLKATEQSTYTMAWFALVVGIHFLSFGRVFWAGWYVVGIVLSGGALGGATTGFLGDPLLLSAP